MASLVSEPRKSSTILSIIEMLLQLHENEGSKTNEGTEDGHDHEEEEEGEKEDGHNNGFDGDDDVDDWWPEDEKEEEKGPDPIEVIWQKLGEQFGYSEGCLEFGSPLRAGVCDGLSQFAEKSAAAYAACEATGEYLCIANSLGWIDEEGLRNRAVVEADLATSAVSQSMTGAEEECDSFAHEATCDITMVKLSVFLYFSNWKI